ncbi:hypothetical protein SCP_0503640 [Sparassis crispa]|uniref:Zn(2)-C6 fungal-type domain-containing protein n=1 Tax=Sparassis crispa TaxID=139825 RepID=A0A401GM92_9APHY|nr:hypothetical protein SCP_0503640 [Sparassis crispa]GBE83316.1 hypothetical protein SCP_0503640 [Sparassis crispa]
MPQSSTASARAQEQEFKRARGAISCAECRRLKLKCDKTVPCSSCKRRGCSSICPNGSLTTGQGTRFILADTDRLHRKIAEMSDRIRQLEDALTILQSSVTRETHPLLTGDLLLIKSGLELHSAISPPQPESEDGGQADEEVQYIDAFGTLAVRDDGAATFYGRSAGSESLLLEENPKPTLQRKKGRVVLHDDITRLTKSFPASPSNLQVDDAEDMIVRYLPPWTRAAQLCDLYLEQAPWFFGAVTRRQLVEEVLPLFYPEAEAYRDAEAGRTNTGPALSSSASAFDLPAVAPKPAQWSAHDLALLFVVFCFGALTDETLPPVPNNPEADGYFQLARAAMNIEPVLERPPSVVTVQTLSLMGIYMGLVPDENSIEGTWSLMGLSSKLAQSIGLHRDCARWKLSPAEVQKRRSLFWELFITDCWQALATGRLPTFSLPFVDTELAGDPDETISDDGTAVPSFPAWKARFGKECVAEVVQGTLTSRAPKYTVILELDRKIRDMQMPRYAIGPAPVGSGLRETMLHFMPINYRELTLLYVHRCFFAQALTDNPIDPLKSQYAPSFLAGYRSACALLLSLREAFVLFPVQIARFWVLWTHAFSAAVMLASVVTHGGLTKTAQAALGELRLAYDLFEKAALHGGRSVQFLPIVRRLHEKAYSTYTQGIQPVRKDIFTPRAQKEESQDELSIFSGRTPRTVATKTGKQRPNPARSVSRRRTAVTGASNPPQAPSDTSSGSTAISPSVSGSGSGSASGSSRDSTSPQNATRDTFPALDSYGASVHPLLADQMRSFSGELDSQINAYYAAHAHEYAASQEEQPYLAPVAPAQEEEWYAAADREAMPPPPNPPPSSSHSQYQVHAMPPPPAPAPPSAAQMAPAQPVYAHSEMHAPEGQYHEYGAPSVPDLHAYAFQQEHGQGWGHESELVYSETPMEGYHQQAQPADYHPQEYPEEYPAQQGYQEMYEKLPPAEYHQTQLQLEPQPQPRPQHHQQYYANAHTNGQDFGQVYGQHQGHQQSYQTHQTYDTHSRSRSHSRRPSAQQYPTRIHVPQVGLVEVQPGYNLTETWTSFVQQEVPAALAPSYARRQ